MTESHNPTVVLSRFEDALLDQGGDSVVEFVRGDLAYLGQQLQIYGATDCGGSTRHDASAAESVQSSAERLVERRWHGLDPHPPGRQTLQHAVPLRVYELLYEKRYSVAPYRRYQQWLDLIARRADESSAVQSSGLRGPSRMTMLGFTIVLASSRLVATIMESAGPSRTSRWITALVT